MSYFIYFILAFAAIFPSIRLVNSQSAEEFKYATILDHDNRVQLEWLVDKTAKQIRFKLIAIGIKRFPFVIGFGASDRGEFENADLVVFDLQSRNSNLTYLDCYTDEKGVLKADTSPDYVFESFKLRRNTLEVIFSRLFDTCDPNDYRIEPGTVHLVHFTLSTTQSLHSLVQKSAKFRPKKDAESAEMKQTQLIKSTFFDSSVAYFDSQKHKKIDIINQRIRLPADETTYWCRVYKLDEQEFKLKHHIIAYESVISEASRGVAHHMELFHCLTDPSSNMRTYNGPCRSEAKPEGLTQCRQVIAAWAMGASRFVYPESVGGVLGGPDYSPYIVLEVHFDNPKQRANIIDSSGIRIYYQGGRDEPLRTYDAGIMEIGLEYNPKNSIPPQTESFHLHGHCLSECTRAALANQPITVFAAQLHTHLTGRRVWTSLVRGNQVVRVINADNHFDQMFQEIRMLQEPVEIQPGDGLVNTCVFETMDRTKMTLGGYGIRDEMCITYMHYYPSVGLELCKSSIADAVLDDFFDKMRYFDRSNTSSKRKSVEENFNSIRWTPLTTAMLSRLYDIAPLAFSCNRSDGTNFASVYDEAKRHGGWFKPIRAKNMSTRYAPVEMRLRDEPCETLPDYGFDEDYEQLDELF